jgi:hypothetical protein
MDVNVFGRPRTADYHAEPESDPEKVSELPAPAT